MTWQQQMKEGVDAVREMLRRLQAWFEPSVDADARPLEIREAIIDDIEQRAEAAGRGRRVFPHPAIVVTVLATDAPARARLDAGLSGLQADVRARLTEIKCDSSSEVLLQVRYVKRPPPTWTPQQRFAVDPQKAQRAEPETSRDTSGVNRIELQSSPTSVQLAPLRIRVLRGVAEQSAYALSLQHVRIGRSARPVDGDGRPRINDIAFAEDGDADSRTVGRAHASLRYDASQSTYRLFDDGSHNGTRILRGGELIAVMPRDTRGIAVKAGDEIQLGSASIAIDAENDV